MSDKFNDEEFKWWIGSESNNEFLKWWYDNDQFEGKYQELAGHAAGAAWFQQQKKIESLQAENEELKSLQGIKEYISKLTDDHRMELVSEFCIHCGQKDLPCYCWNDD